MKIYMIPEKISCLIFDVDLTLYDNREYYDIQKDLLVEKLAEMMGKTTEQTLAMIEKKQKKYMADHEGRKLSLGNLFTLFGVTMEQNCAWRTEQFKPEEYLLPDISMARSLAELSEQYCITAVTNNTTEIGNRTLAAIGIKQYFSVVIGLDQTFKSKPHMAPFKKAATGKSRVLKSCIFSPFCNSCC